MPVNGSLNQIKIEVEEDLARETDLIEAEIDRLRFNVEQAGEKLDQTNEQELADLAGNLEEQRAELLSIQQMDFLTEAQYRDLDERWGHIFEAGMGA